MKKSYIVALLFSFFILIFGILYFFTSPVQEKNSSGESLADMQNVKDVESVETPVKQERLSPEKQKQLDQIKEIYTQQERAYETLLLDILKKYKNNFSWEDRDLLIAIAENTTSIEEFKKELQEKLNLNFLQSDIRNILNFKEKLKEEKDLETTRFEAFKESNRKDLENNTQKLIRLSIQNTLEKNSSLSQKEIINIQRQMSLRIFKKNNILEYDTYKKQKDLLQETLSLIFKQITSLSLQEKQSLIIKIIEDISSLEVLLPSQENDIISFSSSLKSLLLPQSYATTVDITPEERQILILKTQVHIEQILQKSIETEILFNDGWITQLEYQNIIEQNLIELEELVILKSSLENDASVISLSDIQRFNLWAYTDDSELIQDLPVLAYIQSKTWHVIVQNLNGSSRLGEENTSLYSGYRIETLENSSVTLIFSDESILRLEPLSQVRISNPIDASINVAVERGSIWTRVLKPLFSGDVFTIDAGWISLWVRGTSLALRKDLTGMTVNIVDSYTSDGSPSVTLTEKTSWTTSLLLKGKEILVDSTNTVNIQDKTKLTLLSEKPQFADFLREDLRYLSLTLDDRKRGFYNTPITIKNDSENFLKKLEWELESSLPQGEEVLYLLKNSEIQSELVSSGSIYHLIQKDKLISDIKNNPIWDIALKIQAIKDLDMQKLEKTLGNKRTLENRFLYNISEDIVLKNTLTPSKVKNIFLAFSIGDAQKNAKLLSKVKQALTINGGKNIVSGDISLPTTLSWVTITWKSESPSIISSWGSVSPSLQDMSVILTAKLTLWSLSTTKDFWLLVIKKEPTEQEKLQFSLDFLTAYLRGAPTYGKFIDRITLPDFAAKGLIVPKITWEGEIVNVDGTTNRPKFNESSIERYKKTSVLATLTHPSFPGITLQNSYNIEIKRKDCQGNIIGKECYMLVAEANYNGSGTSVDDYKLWNLSPIDFTTSIPMLGDISRKNLPPIMSQGGQRGIKPRRADMTAIPPRPIWDTLSYDISSLNLQDDWAIEMSVRGEDLKRNDRNITGWAKNNWLLSIPSELYIFNRNSGFEVNDTSGLTSFSSTIPNWYQKMQITKNKLYFNGNSMDLNNITLPSIVHIWSFHDSSQQWNSIINYVKIYKKE